VIHGTECVEAGGAVVTAKAVFGPLTLQHHGERFDAGGWRVGLRVIIRASVKRFGCKRSGRRGAALIARRACAAAATEDAPKARSFFREREHLTIFTTRERE